MKEITAAASSAAKLLPSELLTNLFGPATKTIGDELGAIITSIVENPRTERVLRAANLMRRDPKAFANLRVAMKVLGEARHTSDTATLLYLAGVLAASATSESGDDDSALPIANLVCRLSGFEIKTHFLLYEAIRRNWRDFKVLTYDEDRIKCEVILGQEYLIDILGLAGRANAEVILESTILGLMGDQLLGPKPVMCGPSAFRDRLGIKFGKYGILATPSINGIRLYLWANGLPNYKVQDFLVLDDDLFTIQVNTKDSPLETFIQSVSKPERIERTKKEK